MATVVATVAIIAIMMSFMLKRWQGKQDWMNKVNDTVGNLLKILKDAHKNKNKNDDKLGKKSRINRLRKICSGSYIYRL